MALKTASLVFLTLIASAGGSTQTAVTNTPAPTSPASGSCPVTLPGDSKFGNAYLETVLWSDGTIIFEPNGPGFVLDDGSLKMKFPWIRRVSGALSIRGRRLDGSAPELRAEVKDGYGPSGFQPSYLIFPTVGCWEVTGSVGGHELTFVTRVVKKDA